MSLTIELRIIKYELQITVLTLIKRPSCYKNSATYRQYRGPRHTGNEQLRLTTSVVVVVLTTSVVTNVYGQETSARDRKQWPPRAYDVIRIRHGRNGRNLTPRNSPVTPKTFGAQHNIVNIIQISVLGKNLLVTDHAVACSPLYYFVTSI